MSAILPLKPVDSLSDKAGFFGKIPVSNSVHEERQNQILKFLNKFLVRIPEQHKALLWRSRRSPIPGNYIENSLDRVTKVNGRKLLRDLKDVLNSAAGEKF